MFGPLLFVIYINDLIDVISPPVPLKLFADDSVILKETSSVADHQVPQESLLEVHHWCEKWNMDLNIDKTVLLWITRKKKKASSYQYCRQNSNICEVPHLGI